MSNTPSSSPAGTDKVDIYVFLSEYGFRIEPGFAVASRGHVLVIWNYTASDLELKFPPAIQEEPLRVTARGRGEVLLKEGLPRGFYAYSAYADIGNDQKLEALGGSGPGVIIRP